MTFNRYRAFGTHLLGSLFIALSSAALVFLVWYPKPLASAAGVTHIFLLLLAVDVVIGPFITLVVFNPAKKELKRDLAIVLLLQIAALIYGLHTVFVARPVYIVYNVDRFDLVFANDLSTDKLKAVSNPHFKSPPVWGPETIAAEQPKDREARTKLMFSAAVGGDDLAQMPQYYVPYQDLRAVAVKRTLSLENLRKTNPSQAQEVAALIAKYSGRTPEVGYLPVRGKVKDLIAMVDRESANVLELVELSPW